MLAAPQLTPLGAFELERFGELRDGGARRGHRRGRGARATRRHRTTSACARRCAAPCATALDLPRQRRPIVEVQITRLNADDAGGTRGRGGGGAMIGRLNHVAIAVPDLEAAAGSTATSWAPPCRRSPTSRRMACGPCSSSCPTPRSSSWACSATASPIRGFLEKNPAGGIHHVCYEVDDILAARDRLLAQGARVLGDGEPKLGAHDKPVLFLHPKDFMRHAGRARAGMTTVGAIVTFTVVWWLVFFMALPFGAAARGAAAARQRRERARAAAPAAEGGGHDRARRRSSPGASPGSSRAA